MTCVDSSRSHLWILGWTATAYAALLRSAASAANAAAFDDLHPSSLDAQAARNLAAPTRPPSRSAAILGVGLVGYASALAQPFPLPVGFRVPFRFLFAPLFSCSLCSGSCSCAPLTHGWRLLSLPHLTSAAVSFSLPPPFTPTSSPTGVFISAPLFLLYLFPRPALFSPLWSLCRSFRAHLCTSRRFFRVPLSLFAPLPTAVVCFAFKGSPNLTLPQFFFAPLCLLRRRFPLVLRPLVLCSLVLRPI